jgi:hypothetical protein
MFRATVFLGKVSSVVDDPRGSAATTFEVLETLHSAFALGKSVTLHHGTIGSMCGIEFVKGTTYVVYAGGNSLDALGAGACSRTHVATKNDPDVAFAHATSTRKTALIEGQLELSTGDTSSPKAGVEVRASGTNVAAKSNAKGAFKLEVPPGTYTLEVTSPGLRLWDGRAVEVALPVASACAHPVLSVTWDGRIEGTVTDPDGQPVAGAEIGAIAVRERDRHWRLSARTDAQGHYLIRGASAASYLVGVSLPDYSGSDPQSPWATTYFPGVPELAKAKPVIVKQAALTPAIDFVLPRPARVATLRGTVTQADGSPSVGASVTIAPTGKNRSTSGLTDKSGAWSLQELAGEDIALRACAYDQGPPLCVEVQRKVEGDAVIDLKLPTRASDGGAKP